MEEEYKQRKKNNLKKKNKYENVHYKVTTSWQTLVNNLNNYRKKNQF